MNADNSTICAEIPGSDYLPITLRKVAAISPDAAQSLPRDFLNCILGTTAVHMAARNPGNRPVERLALEAKVCLFESINTAFQQPVSKVSSTKCMKDIN
jgi:hypothetical protein